jgi:hypothetical protein
MLIINSLRLEIPRGNAGKIIGFTYYGQIKPVWPTVILPAKKHPLADAFQRIY